MDLVVYPVSYLVFLPVHFYSVAQKKKKVYYLFLRREGIEGITFSFFPYLLNLL